MIHPAPTSKIDPRLARGTLADIVQPTATKEGYIVLAIPNTSYLLHLRVSEDFSAPVGTRLIGRIEVDARRIDRPNGGGRYVEPVEGRPRRVQGWVIATDPERNIVWVSAGVPVGLRPTAPGQHARDFSEGEFVSCDVKDGAAFMLAE